MLRCIDSFGQTFRGVGQSCDDPWEIGRDQDQRNTQELPVSESAAWSAQRHNRLPKGLALSLRRDHRMKSECPQTRFCRLCLLAVARGQARENMQLDEG